jgi:hypothetical protein
VDPHLAVYVAIAVTIARLLAYAIDNRDRWRRFLSLVLLALTVAAVWWVFARGGVHVLRHDFGRT